jgi:hypothetical protein
MEKLVPARHADKHTSAPPPHVNSRHSLTGIVSLNVVLIGAVQVWDEVDGALAKPLLLGLGNCSPQAHQSRGKEVRSQKHSRDPHSA